MEYIKAPFNFVPVSSEVYYPGWADQISHDIPFSDGISGKLSITIEAKTPIFIRDSKSKSEFCHIMTPNDEKKYFIPGTSIKGMVRNVLEILSFSKFDKINDSKYAIRDLHNSQVYTLMDNSSKIMCGWLSITKNDQTGKETVKIVNCGIPWRISHQQLDDKCSTHFVDTFKQRGTAFRDNGNGTKFKEEYFKTAKYKYTLFNDGTTQHCFKEGTLIHNRQLCLFSDDSSGKKGTIVFTGQSSARTQNQKGKFYEFVFIEPESTAAENLLSVDEQIWSNFKFHYYDYDDNKASVDWKWRKSQLEKNEKIPVFFRLDDNDPTKVKDLGLSYLYKMPYKHSVKDLLPEKHKQFGGPFKPDLAESIFGFTDSDGSLKGRVSIGPAFVQEGTTVPTADQKTVFGSPKASYYPLYIKQSGNNGRVDSTYKTFMDDDAVLSGFKRYPVKNIATPRTDVGHVSENMKVDFNPLTIGAKFVTTIRYFNLRPVELGALLSALTFHNNSTDCYHALGMGKPDGFGRVSIQIQGMDSNEMTKYLNEFESELSAYLSENENDYFKWNESPQVKELIAMAKLQNQQVVNDRLKYMSLQEFAQAKKHNLYLEKYSKIVNDTSTIYAYSTTDKLEYKKKILDNQKKAKTQLEQKRKETEKTEKEQQLKPINENLFLEQGGNNSEEKTFQIGQHFSAVVCNRQSVNIPFLSYTVNTQLVLTREEKDNPPESGSEISVVVKQVTRTGRISQVTWKK